MPPPKTPCCGAAPIVQRTPREHETPGVVRSYQCSECGDEQEACAAELSAGGHCQRLATECSYHDGDRKS